MVQIVNITPVESCSRPLRGTLFYAPGQGDDISAHLYFNLNDPRAPASYTNANSSIKHPDYFGNYTISLKYGEVFTFQITAAVLNKSCQFTLTLTGIVNGKTFAESVNNHGQPFRVTSLLLVPPAADDVPDFAGYQDLYAAGAGAAYKQNQNGTVLWIRVNPKSYPGRLS